MKLLDALMSLFRKADEDPAKVAVLHHEQTTVERLARISGRTPEQVRQEIRRRALSVEVDSMRRSQ